LIGLAFTANTFAGKPARAQVFDFTELPNLEVIEGGHAQLVRSGNGVSVVLRTVDLVPGDAYTLWIVVFNFPEYCGIPFFCFDTDIGNPDVAADILYITGNVVGGSGRGTFAGRLAAGDVSGSIFNVPPQPFPFPPAVGLLNPESAELHFIVHSHGQKLPDYMPSMIQSFGGGCVDPGAPFIGLFIVPEWGVPGPNTCESHQFTVFPSPDAP
jgi:hypothetical protein